MHSLVIENCVGAEYSHDHCRKTRKRNTGKRPLACLLPRSFKGELDEMQCAHKLEEQDLKNQ